MSVSELFGWVEDHPILAAVLGITGLLIILWLLGVFSSSRASTNDGGNMASAYYAAEAAQAAAGAQIQKTQIEATAATSIAARQAMMNEALGQIQATAATTINGQNTGAAMTINAQDNYTARALSSDQLQVTANTNAWAAWTAGVNNDTARLINYDNNRTSIFNTFLNNVVPAEIAAGQYTLGHDVAGQSYGASTAPSTPQWMREHGYSESQIARAQLGY